MKSFRCYIGLHRWQEYATYDSQQYYFFYCGVCKKWRHNDDPNDADKYPDLQHWYRDKEASNDEEMKK